MKRDLIMQSKSGTGKTLAFLLLTYFHLQQKTSSPPPTVPDHPNTSSLFIPTPQTIILAPTLEIAYQITDTARVIFSSAPPLNGTDDYTIQLLIGGQNLNKAK